MMLMMGKEGKPVKHVSWEAVVQSAYLWLLENPEKLIKQIIRTRLKGNEAEGIVDRV